MISAPLVTTVTQSSPAGCAVSASAAGILIPWTLSHVIHAPANASNVCITQEASPALSVKPVTMEMHLPRTAGVSTVTLQLYMN